MFDDLDLIRFESMSPYQKGRASKLSLSGDSAALVPYDGHCGLTEAPRLGTQLVGAYSLTGAGFRLRGVADLRLMDDNRVAVAQSVLGGRFYEEALHAVIGDQAVQLAQMSMRGETLPEHEVVFAAAEKTRSLGFRHDRREYRIDVAQARQMKLERMPIKAVQSDWQLELLERTEGGVSFFRGDTRGVANYGLDIMTEEAPVPVTPAEFHYVPGDPRVTLAETLRQIVKASMPTPGGVVLEEEIEMPGVRVIAGLGFVAVTTTPHRVKRKFAPR